MQAFPRVSLQKSLLIEKEKHFEPLFLSTRFWPLPRVSAQRDHH